MTPFTLFGYGVSAVCTQFLSSCFVIKDKEAKNQVGQRYWPHVQKSLINYDHYSAVNINRDFMSLRAHQKHTTTTTNTCRQTTSQQRTSQRKQ